MKCRSCGEDNPDRAKFCLECATPLTAAPPVPVVQERKVVTVLFCDLVGFTSASESADPEDVQARLSAYHSMLRTEIERYGGTVEKFIGDAVMAVFGAPTAHEDDPERAVRAGLRIVEATVELNEQQPGLDLRVRLGINTGEALVNVSAHPERGEGFVTGDVVNTASRLQGAAPVNGVAVGQLTYEATKAVFDYVELEPAELKGKSERVPLYAAVAARSRFGTDLTRRHATPLVGREIDLALLKGAFDKALSGPSLQLVTVVGEPGVGKSRLVTELFHHIDSLPELVRFRQGRCLPYGEGITFWAVGEIVKAETGILDTDDPDTARAKLQQTLARLIEDPNEHSWFANRLSPLLGLQAAASGSREETFTAWRRFLEATAAENPTVCVIEDVHWADDALLGFIEHLADWCQGVPLLVVCTARPELYEKHPNWGAGLRNAIPISVAPLSDMESAKLVSALLGRAVLPAETQTLLVERSGGNPLYAEEFIRMLSDRELLDEAGRLAVNPDELTFPTSVQAIIAARLDTLPPERKAVLQNAAVIGKVFWAGAVAALSAQPEDQVAQDLHALSKKELVRRSRTSTVAGQVELSFWHAFIRDVAYNTIPRAIRSAKHQAAAGWVETTAGGRLEEYAEILAHHYLTALELAAATATGDAEYLRDQARQHLLIAGRRTLDVDVPTAQALLRIALDITPPEHSKRPDVQVPLARALEAAGRSAEARQFLKSAEAIFQSQGRTAQAAGAQVALADTVSLHDPDEANRMMAHAISTLESLPPGPHLIDALERAAGLALVGSRFEESIVLTDRTLALLDAGVLTEGPTELTRARLLNYRGCCRIQIGDVDGLKDLRASLQLDPNHASFHANLGMALGVTQGPAVALDEVEEAIRLATAQGNRIRAWSIQEIVFEMQFPLGRWDESVALAPAVMDGLKEIGDAFSLVCVEAWDARIHVLRGTEHGAQLVESLLPAARRIGEPQVVLPALMVAGLAAGELGDRAALASLLREAEPLLSCVGQSQQPIFLPEFVRLAVSVPDIELAHRLVEQTPPSYPGSLASLASARAAIAEARCHLDEAITCYTDAVTRWTDLGDVVERAYALLGLGRTGLAAGDPAGVDGVQASRRIWADLGAKPLIAEADSLLNVEERLTS